MSGNYMIPNGTSGINGTQGYWYNRGMIAYPVFIFYRDQMMVTDREKMNPGKEPGVLEESVAFDASAQSLTSFVNGAFISFRETGVMDEEEFKKRMAEFWRASGNPIPGIENMDLRQAVESSVFWLKEREWKTYLRGSRLFWTLMWPSALIPFIVGFFKLPMTAKTLRLYSACFLISMLVIAGLHRLLYPKPPFPRPGK